MNFLKRFGATCKKWFAENFGDFLITLGLFITSVTTFFVNLFLGFYVLALVLILIGLIYVKAKGGD